MSTAENVAQLETSEKFVAVGKNCTLKIRFKDFYIIRAGKADFTGLRVWPGAELLARFLYFAGERGLLTRSQCLVELGAGVGVPSLVAAKYAGHCIITDRIDTLLQLITENIRLNGLQEHASVYNLAWGADGAQQLRAAYSAKSDATRPSNTSDSSPSSAASAGSYTSPFFWDPSRGFVIAADVVYPDTSNEALAALFSTVDELLAQPHSEPQKKRPATSFSSASVLPLPLVGSFICAYFSRDGNTSKRFLLAAWKAGFEAAAVEENLFPNAASGLSSFSGHGLRGLVIMFRKPQHGASSLSPSTASFPEVLSADSSKESLPSFMLQEPFLSLWRPPLSKAALAVEELNDATEENVLSGLAIDSEDENDAKNTGTTPRTQRQTNSG